MKRVFLFVLALSVLIACVPTPEEDAVKQKDTNVLIDTVKSEQESGTQTGAAALPVSEQLPERFQCEFTTSQKNVHVTADVPIEILSMTGSFPMLRVEHRFFSDAERLTIVKRLLKSDDLYIYEYRPTREALERMIRELMQEPTPEDKAEFMADFGTEEEWQQMMERRKETLEQYQKQYNEMSDDTLPPLLRWSGAAPEYDKDFEHNSNQIMIVNSESVSGFFDYANIWANECDRPIEFEIARRDVYDITTVWFFDNPNKFGTERIDPNNYDTPHEGANLTPNDAIKIVQSYFDGFGSFAASDVYWANNAATDGDVKGIQSNTRWAYLIHLSPVTNGAYQMYCSGSAGDDDPDTQFVGYWDYETLMAAVDGEGTLLSVVWVAPLKVTEVIAESTPLLPYEEIQKIFMRQMDRVFFWERHQDGTLAVDSVQLGLFRIREKGNINTGLLVPAWFFTGTFTYSEEQKAKNMAEGESEEQAAESHFDSLNALCIINAIDGNIIDPYKGY